MTSPTVIKLIAGLGNPGSRYEDTRHNVGFWFVDRFAARHGASLRPEGKFQGDAGVVQIGGRQIRLLKPTTFMNLSGQAVGAMASYYKIDPEEILVVHDEIDLPPGKLRVKAGGGHGGHNGLRDIVSHIGRDFLRLRVGVGHPGSAAQVVDYVLHRPSADENREIDDALGDALDALPMLWQDSMEKLMQRLHSRGVKAKPYRKSDKTPAEKPAASPPQSPKPQAAQTPAESSDGDIKSQLLKFFKPGGRKQD